MALTATSIADVLIHSLNKLGRMKMTDAMSNYTKTVALKRILKKKGNESVVDSGPEVQFNIIIDTNGSARSVPLGYTTVTDMPNVLAVGKMPWRNSHWNYSIEDHLVTMNSGDAKILDYVQTQRIAGLGSFVLYMENVLWTCPVLADFTLEPVGIPYFVVKSNTAFTTTNQGMNGGAPSGYTVVANLNPTTDCNGRWKNYAEQYTSVTQDDLITKMCRCQEYTDFEPLVDEIPTNNLGNDYGIYTNYAVMATLRGILQSQNENLGTEIAWGENKAVFMRTPMQSIRQLDPDTTNPVYMLNWGELGAKSLRGWWLKEQAFGPQANQPTVRLTVVDSTWNLFCTNRRRQGVIATNTTMPTGAGAA